ncbi:zinc-dependent peptidase [Stenotrophomonas sp.]|uniref:zinc-dependent peptidase n=1 Tax=Stenotrophomonas sp. TaxID=69392 RepID=UPI0028B01C32|nr:zinc-dependent peptidase [Stenotrophomonas sp.]
MTAAGRPPRWRWLAGLLLAVGAATSAQAQLQVELSGQDLDVAEQRVSQRLIDDVLARLPPTMRQADVGPLQLRWRSDLPAQVQGRAHGRDLGLDRGLLAPLLEAASSDAWQQARAALIHEIAHALDRAHSGGWSAQARFRDLAGWQRRPLLPGRSDNRNSLRSPDHYELHSPAEFFAVNIEHYLLDPDYRCRRPALYAWLQQQLGTAPAVGAIDCPTSLPLMQADEEAGSAALIGLDPKRVYQVDYLLAEGNERLMSRWGHSMLRLVICAPGRPPGPACRMDLQHHLVLSFRAYVGDVQISSLRGLTGSYPSRLFVLPLNRVVDEYTKVELRGVSSTPLALQPDEITALLVQAAQLHWSYDGRYYFISNNCAVETWKLLQDGVPRMSAHRLASITPTGLVRRLRGQGLTAGVPADHSQAVREGYYFESAATHLQAVFAVVQAALAPPVANAEQWLALPAAQRRRWMDRGNGKALAAMLVLEQVAWRRQELLARDALKRRLLSPRGDTGQRVQFDAFAKRAGALLAPGSLPVAGYGLPSLAEREALQAHVQAGASEAMGQWQGLRQAALALLTPAQRRELGDIESNLETLRHGLRLLYGTQPGEAAHPSGMDRRGFKEKTVEHDGRAATGGD